MNVTPTTQKLILSLIIVAFIGFVVFTTLFGSSETPISTDGVFVDNAVGQDILILSNKLNTININQEVFDSPLFQSLIDISSPVNVEETGRPDPFAAIGQ